ncbi:MAG: ATP-binding protein [Bacteroidales bacterium]|nr:ATP-binding protein [Bacteroidales bacterium]
MFQRNAIKWLRNWRTKENRKPLIVRGARQVGKTSLIKTFAKEFNSFLSFNLENPDDLQLFSREMSAKEFFDLLLSVRRKKKEGDILLFIDEIQNSPFAVKVLRFFYEELPDVYVIAAGSLLETMINTEISFPVGRVEFMALRPCTFTEFLGAIDEKPLRDMIENFDVPDVLHNRVMTLFNQYALVGGMPEAVAQYAKKRDLVALDNVYQPLLTSYSDDVEKYKKNETMRNVLRLIINNGWQYAASRITFERFGNSNYKSREVGEAMRTLQKAMLLELTYPTTETTVPFSDDMRKKPKLMWLDTGLVNYAAGVQSELFGKTDIVDAWKGKIAEHIVGQELLGQSNLFLDYRHFWVREEKNSQAEIDFLYKNRLYGAMPIEVKSGHNAHLKALNLFMEQASCRYAMRFWAKQKTIDTITLPSGKQFALYNLPYYYAGQVENIMDKIFANR